MPLAVKTVRTKSKDTQFFVNFIFFFYFFIFRIIYFFFIKKKLKLKMLQSLLFPETITTSGFFDPVKTTMSVLDLVNIYKKKEIKDFETEKM